MTQAQQAKAIVRVQNDASAAVSTRAYITIWSEGREQDQPLAIRRQACEIAKLIMGKRKWYEMYQISFLLTL